MSVFPTFASGESVHVPFTQGTEFWNVVNRMAHGWQYSYNVLPDGLKRWEIELSFSDADWATLLAAWNTSGGAYEEFTFTDPDTAVTTNKCRFDQETLEPRFVGPNEILVSVAIQEYK